MLETSRLRDFSVASQSIGTELQCWPLFSPPDRVHFPLHNTTTKSIQTQHPNKISAGQKKSHTHVLEYQATCQTNAVLLEGKGLALLYFCHCAVKDNSAGLGCANLENPKERSDPCPAPYREPLSPQNFLLGKSIFVYLRPWPLQMVYDNSVIYGGGLGPYGITLTSGGLETEQLRLITWESMSIWLVPCKNPASRLWWASLVDNTNTPRMLSQVITERINHCPYDSIGRKTTGSSHLVSSGLCPMSLFPSLILICIFSLE